MTFEQAIHDRYGVRVPVTPGDLKLRKFKVDELRNGFLMKDSETGVFGSFIDGEAFIWSPESIIFFAVEHKDNKEIRFEWMIWEGARATFERGERLSRVDRERLELAVQRLEQWL